MDRTTLPDDYEDRIETARAAASRLPDGPERESAERVLAQAPTRERFEAVQQAAARASAFMEQLKSTDFDGTDDGRVVWLRLDYTGRLRSLALSPTVDRLSNRAVGGAIQAAWGAAEAARAEYAARIERAGSDLFPRHAPDPRLADLRERVARSPERFSSGATDDDPCEAEVTLTGRLTGFRFLVPNITLDIEYEQLAAEAAGTIGRAQQRATERLAALAAAIG